MNAIKEEALNILKKIIADFVDADGNIKPKEQKIVGHINPLFLQQ